MTSRLLRELVEETRDTRRSAARVRAEASRGISNDAILSAVLRELRFEEASGRLVDVGCGRGDLLDATRTRFEERIGVDLVRFGGLPDHVRFVEADLDADGIPLPDGHADCTVSVETIEHLENPRSFVREMVRITRPGGLIVITTPNQLSLLSKLTLVLRDRFQAFQDASYPAHLTALLGCDLLRIAGECGIVGARLSYTHRGRLPGLPWHHPTTIAKWFPRALSDNVLLVGRTAAAFPPRIADVPIGEGSR